MEERKKEWKKFILKNYTDEGDTKRKRDTKRERERKEKSCELERN